MKNEKEYTLVYTDIDNNDIAEKIISATSKKEAKKQIKVAFSTCMINDCKKIIIR